MMYKATIVHYMIVEAAVSIPQSELRSLRSSLRQLEAEIGRALDEQMACCEVTLSQCHGLLAIDQLQTASIAEVAAKLNLDTSTLSRLVDSLVQAGLVDRSVDPNNRRRALVSLSPAGKARAEAIHQGCDHYYSRMLNLLSHDERRLCLELIPRLAQAMRSAREAEGDRLCC